MDIRKIFLILAGVLVIIAGIVFYRQKTRIDFHPPTMLSPGRFELDVQAGVWVDTGVFVGSNSIVWALSNGPFYLAVDNVSQESTLIGSAKQEFFADVWTYRKNVPSKLMPTKTAYITNKGRIYFWAERFSKITFEITPLGPALEQELNEKFKDYK